MEEKFKTKVEYVDGWKIVDTYPIMTTEEQEKFQDEIMISLHKIFSAQAIA